MARHSGSRDDAVNSLTGSLHFQCYSSPRCIRGAHHCKSKSTKFPSCTRNASDNYTSSRGQLNNQASQGQLYQQLPQIITDLYNTKMTNSSPGKSMNSFVHVFIIPLATRPTKYLIIQISAIQSIHQSTPRQPTHPSTNASIRHLSIDQLYWSLNPLPAHSQKAK